MIKKFLTWAMGKGIIIEILIEYTVNGNIAQD